MAKFSIIIPVYNTLEYLKACLTSILHQEFKDVEVIVVNDGSNDDSHVLLEYYHHHYPNMTLIHQENHGLSHSRNVGLEVATGEYVLFLDSDDAFIPNSLKGLAEFLEVGQPDVTVLNWMSYHKGKRLEYYEYYAAKKLRKMHPNNGKAFVIKMLQQEPFWEMYPWCLAYRREYLVTHQFKFKADVVFEDMIFCWEALLNAKLVNYYPYHIVLYTRKREGQITRTITYKNVLSRVLVSNYWLDHIEQYNFTQFEKYTFLCRIANLYFSGVLFCGMLDKEEQAKVFVELEKGQEFLRYGPNAFIQSAYDLVRRLGFERAVKLIGKKSRFYFYL